MKRLSTLKEKDEEQSPEILEPQKPEAPEVEPTSTVRKVRQTSEWTERVPPRKERPPTTGQSAPPIVYEEEYTPTPIDLFLEELDNEIGYILRVDRMPNYENDGLQGMKADRNFCRIYKYTAQALTEHKFLEDIQNGYGGGAYWLILRDSDGRILKQWAEHIDGLPKSKEQPPQLAQPAQSAITQTFPIQNPLEQFENLLELATKLKDAFGWDKPQAPVEATSPAPEGMQPQPPTEPQSEIAQKSIIRFLVRVAEDCIENVDVNATVDKGLNLSTRFPQYQQLIGQLFVGMPGDVLKLLQAYASGVDFTMIQHAETWVVDFQAAAREMMGNEGTDRQSGENT